MDSYNVLCKISAALANTMPALQRIPWEDYGVKLSNSHPDGTSIGSSILVAVRAMHGNTVFSCQHGEISDLGSAHTVLNRKLALALLPNSLCSLDYRNPSLAHWGGGFRLSDGSAIAMTRLPELGDHLLLGYLLSMNFSKLFPLQLWKELLRDADRPSVVAAISHKAMTDRQYKKLSLCLEEIALGCSI